MTTRRNQPGKAGRFPERRKIQVSRNERFLGEPGLAQHGIGDAVRHILKARDQFRKGFLVAAFGGGNPITELCC